MPDTAFSRPTLAALIDRISSDINARFPGKDSRVRRSVLWVFGRVLAGAAYLLWGFLQWIARQIMPDTADGDRLVRHAAIWGLTPLPATYGGGNVTFTGTAGTVHAGAILQRDDGAEYALQADATLAGGVATGTVLALVAGLAGNCDAGVVLTLASPVSGVNSAATVAGYGNNVKGGLDAETVEALRSRLLDKIANRPQGGAVADYNEWAREVAGVSRVFVSPLELGPGTVTVRFTVAGTGAAVIPDYSAVAAVAAHIDTLRPVTAEVHVLAPVGLAVTFTIHLSPDNSATRAAVTAELEDLLAREGAPSSTIYNSQIREAISRAPGESSHTLADVGGGGGLANIVQNSTQVAYRGTISWV